MKLFLFIVCLVALSFAFVQRRPGVTQGHTAPAAASPAAPVVHKQNISSFGTSSAVSKSVREQGSESAKPTEAITPGATVVENEGTWSTPDRPEFLDENQEQTALIEELQGLTVAADSPVDEPVYEGENVQGLDVYSFNSHDGRVTEWRHKNGELGMSITTFNDGTKVTHFTAEKTEEGEREHSIWREFEDGSIEEVAYYPSGAVKSIYRKNQSGSSVYNYDESGRVSSIWKN